MKLIFILFLIFFFFPGYASDTLHVVSHDRETVVTDPSKGYNYYSRWAVFPSLKVPVRKIILHVRFACPDTMRCADWDYLDFITLRRKGGVDSTSLDFEIARMLTPYGGAFSKGWKFAWEVDVTDFSLLLRDSVEIEYNHTGYENNKDRGWKITLDFEIITGRPWAEPVSIQRIYGGAYKYGDSTSPIESFLKPVDFSRQPGASFARFRISQTGHGSNRGDGCGEFCSKTRDVLFNGKTIDTRNMWKECGDNPLYPQAGTWTLDRAAWCPGDLQRPDTYILPLSDENRIDVNMQPYQFKGSEAVENIVAYMIQYKAPALKNDVGLADILVPGNKPVHSRRNPSCHQPVILMTNNGREELKRTSIQYYTEGGKKHSYLWRGSILPGKEAEVTLPSPMERIHGSHRFIVSLSKPNGKTDQYADDNTLVSEFEPAPVHGKDLVLLIKTNNQPQHNSYQVLNSNGQVVYNRVFDSSQKNRVFRDTVRLAEGCYTFHLEDLADDGLEFWFNTRGGSGFVRIQDIKGNLLQQFDSDFGSYLSYHFSVSNDSTMWSAANVSPAIVLYPTRTTGKTTLDFFSGLPMDVTVQIITDEGGQLVEEHHYKKLKEGSFTYDLSYRPAQRYYLRVLGGGNLLYNKRIRVSE